MNFILVEIMGVTLVRKGICSCDSYNPENSANVEPVIRAYVNSPVGAKGFRRNPYGLTAAYSISMLQAGNFLKKLAVGTVKEIFCFDSI
ncbi:MAG: hypothetical protein ABIC04_01425 [Nanoarchaeota archaeon]